MPRELFLHIGTTKTGSTSIQFVLEAQRREMLTQGVYYPKTHGTKRHLLLAFASAGTGRFRQMSGDAMWQGMEPGARIEAYRGEFAAEMEGLPKRVDRVILSAEQFGLLLRSQDQIQRLHDILAPHFSKMTVVIYLRRQDSHYASMYAQMLRMGNLHQPDMAAVRTISFNSDYDYMELLSRWTRIFGEDAVMPRLFERTSSAPFDVVDDFLHLCRVQLSLPPDDEKRSRNPSMSLVGQSVLLKVGEVLERRTGTKHIDGFLWNKVAEAVTSASAGQGWQPTQEEARSFLARFEESNEAVRKRWFPERESLFAIDFSKLPKTSVQADPAASFEVACTALLEAAITGVKRDQGNFLQLAKMAEAAGDHKRKVASLVHLLRTEPGNIGVRAQLIEHHIAQGDLAAANASFRAARKIAPEDPAVQRLGAALTDLGVDIGAPEVVAAVEKKMRPGAKRRAGRRQAEAEAELEA